MNFWALKLKTFIEQSQNTKRRITNYCFEKLLTQVILVHFMDVAAYASELFCISDLSKNWTLFLPF